MDPYQSKRAPRYQKNNIALFLLVLLGCGIVFFAIVQIACSFVINYDDDFQTSNGAGIESLVQSAFSYSQYWAGIPFLLNGILIVCSGIFQRARGLTITTTIFSIASIFIAIFVVAIDGGNWRLWNTQHRLKVYWDSKSGYDCSSVGETCVCTDSSNSVTVGFRCSDITALSSLYGAVVGSSIIVASLNTFVVLMIAKSLSWKRTNRAPKYRDYYTDDYRMDTTRRVPSVIDLPYGKRAQEYEERPVPPSGPPYRQSIYRNYPY